MSGNAAALLLVIATACSATTQQYPGSNVRNDPPTDTSFNVLLARYVEASGGVDYERWHAAPRDVALLDDYLGHLTQATPDTRPDLFPTRRQQLPYWINLYNAIVIREIIRRWPLQSVSDVKPTAASWVVPRRGFFKDLRFAVGDRRLSLDDLEHAIIRAQFKDPRVHFAINCGSSSCPLIRRTAFNAEGLEAQLNESSREFINDRKNVDVDHDKHVIWLSKIFQWYKSDFVDFMIAENGEDATVVDFLRVHATPELSDALLKAKTQGYAVSYRSYDWSVNSRDAAAPPPAHGVGEPVPEVAIPLADGGLWRPSQARGSVIALDFWASYCAPCRQSFPALDRLAEQHAAAGLVVVAVSADEQRDAIERFLAEVPVRFRVGLDPEQSIVGQTFKVTSLPTRIVVDRRGIVRYRDTGAASDDEFLLVLASLLAEPAAP